MKVVILHTDFRIYWPARIYALQQVLNKNKIELFVVEIAGQGSPYAFSKKQTDYKIDNWNILFPDMKMEDLSMSVVKKAILNKLNEINPDVVIAGAIAFPSGAISTLWCKRYKKKIIIFDDAKVDDVKRGGFVNFIKSRIYKSVDAVLYPAKEWDETGFYWGFKKEQIFYGVDVVDNNFWENVKSENKYGLNNGFFLSIGRLIPKKNFKFLLQAYKKYIDIVGVEKASELVIIGDGPDKFVIEDYIKKYSITKVKLLPFLQQNELAFFYRNCKSFILCSKEDETWGLVINEAMACGAPVLASNRCGATKSLVVEGKNGFVFSPFNIDDLCNKLLHVHKMNEYEVTDMSQNSLLKIKEFSTELFADSLFNAIYYVMKKGYSKHNIFDYLILNIWKGRYRTI